MHAVTHYTASMRTMFVHNGGVIMRNVDSLRVKIPAVNTHSCKQGVTMHILELRSNESNS
jgi:hypothetical protein